MSLLLPTHISLKTTFSKGDDFFEFPSEEYYDRNNFRDKGSSQHKSENSESPDSKS
ncbi:MAG TPA: hypothetical protein VJ767_02220 [Nitrososphaeraceae archaeon]|nr:hypothetical protein [Nitrososphaeraceae archaeon]